MYYVYVLQSQKDNGTYIGCTHDLQRRLIEHNTGQNESTKQRSPYKIIYYEAFLNIDDAYKREKIMKGQWGRKFLKRVLKNYFVNK